jgi:DNA-directed RNA polymerase specialized sigma24 family protein
MTAKEYLQRAKEILDKINVRKTMIADKYSAVECRSINYDAVGSHTPNENSTENAYINAAAFEARVKRELAVLDAQLNEIKLVILKVGDGTQERILTMRFIEGKSFESIAEEIGYSERQMFRHYNFALEKISEILNDVSECH